jgi:hypothetical protein
MGKASLAQDVSHDSALPQSQPGSIIIQDT